MEALPVRPQGPHHAPHRAARPTHRAAAAAAAPATPGDLTALTEQAAFDAVASARAEQLREMNVLRDLAMQQVKRDDQTMNAWIKLV